MTGYKKATYLNININSIIEKIFNDKELSSFHGTIFNFYFLQDNAVDLLIDFDDILYKDQFFVVHYYTLDTTKTQWPLFVVQELLKKLISQYIMVRDKNNDFYVSFFNDFLKRYPCFYVFLTDVFVDQFQKPSFKSGFYFDFEQFQVGFNELVNTMLKTKKILFVIHDFDQLDSFSVSVLKSFVKNFHWFYIVTTSSKPFDVNSDYMINYELNLQQPHELVSLFLEEIRSDLQPDSLLLLPGFLKSHSFMYVALLDLLKNNPCLIDNLNYFEFFSVYDFILLSSNDFFDSPDLSRALFDVSLLFSMALFEISEDIILDFLPYREELIKEVLSHLVKCKILYCDVVLSFSQQSKVYQFQSLHFRDQCLTFISDEEFSSFQNKFLNFLLRFNLNLSINYKLFIMRYLDSSLIVDSLSSEKMSQLFFDVIDFSLATNNPYFTSYFDKILFLYKSSHNLDISKALHILNYIISRKGSDDIFEKAIHFIDLFRLKTKDPTMLAKIKHIEIRILEKQNKMDDVYQKSKHYLTEYGVLFEWSNIKGIYVLLKHISTVIRYKKSIFNLDIMCDHDIEMNHILSICERFLVASYWRIYYSENKNLNNYYLTSQSVIYIALQTARIGNFEVSPLIPLYLVFFYGDRFQITKAFKYAKLMIKMLENSPHNIYIQYMSLYYMRLSPLLYTYELSIQNLKNNYHLLMNSLDYSIASSALHYVFVFRLLAAYSLPLIIDELFEMTDSTKDLGFYFDMITPIIPILKEVSEGSYNQMSYLFLSRSKKVNADNATIIFVETLLLFVHCQYDIIAKQSHKLLSILSPKLNPISYLNTLFFVFVSITFSSFNTLKYKSFYKKLLILKTLSEDNFRAKYYVVLGCYEFYQKNYNQSLVYFEKAISMAKQSKNRFDLAISYELRSKVLVHLSLYQLANMDNFFSYQNYEMLGYRSKTILMDSTVKFNLPSLFYQDGQKAATDYSQSMLTKFFVNISNNKNLDDVLSSFLDHVFLISQMEMVSVFLGTNDALNLKGYIKKGQKTILKHSIPLYDVDFCPKNLISLSQQSHKDIFQQNPFRDSFYVSDEYILRNKPGSILIVPLMVQDRCIGVVYFENQKSFLLSNQQLSSIQNFCLLSAVALENNQLFLQNLDLIQTLESRVNEQVVQIQQAEDEKRKSLEIAQKAASQSAYAMLTRGIAHEIRNPMAMILSGTELILDKLDDRKGVERYLNIVKDSILRLKSISTNMLRYGNPVSNYKKMTDLNHLISTVISVSKPESKKRNISIFYEHSEIDFVFIDDNSVYQVFINLILNSIQSIEKDGEIQFKCSNKSYYDKNQTLVKGVCVEISDTGKGISSEKIKKIFDPFFSTKYGNIGLGLSIVFNTIALNNGFIDVQSQLGKGTTFFIYLPCQGAVSNNESLKERVAFKS